MSCPYSTNKQLSAWFCAKYNEPYSHSLARSKKQKFFAYYNPQDFVWYPYKVHKSK
mgnify:CR=1 FL=1